MTLLGSSEEHIPCVPLFSSLTRRPAALPYWLFAYLLSLSLFIFLLLTALLPRMHQPDVNLVGGRGTGSGLAQSFSNIERFWGEGGGEVCGIWQSLPLHLGRKLMT